MEARLGSFGFALFALFAAVACSSGNSAPHAAGKRPDAGHTPARGTPDATVPGQSALRFYTGVLDDTDARVGVVAAAHHARLYFCGGDTTYRELSRWIPAAMGDGGELFPDRTAAMGWAVHATVGEGLVSGSLATGDGGSHGFRATLVDAHTMAGLYEGTSPCGKVGLIVSQASPDDRPVSQGACIGANDIDIHQVNPVAPLAPGAAIQVEVADTLETLELTPAVVAD